MRMGRASSWLRVLVSCLGLSSTLDTSSTCPSAPSTVITNTTLPALSKLGSCFFDLPEGFFLAFAFLPSSRDERALVVRDEGAADDDGERFRWVLGGEEVSGAGLAALPALFDLRLGALSTSLVASSSRATVCGRGVKVRGEGSKGELEGEDEG